MEGQQKILEKVLEAREKRAKLREEISLGKYSTLSISLNIAGFPKYNEKTTYFFESVINDFSIFLKANRIFILEDDLSYKTDEAGHFFIKKFSCNNISLSNLKILTEKFENSHQLGRLIDIDIFDKNFIPFSSGKQKKCLICDKPAIVCMREHNHSYAELRDYTFEKISYFNKKREEQLLVEKIAEIANKSVLYEVALSPKPGLVDFFDSGSHKDMDFYTFLNSAAALSYFWQKFAFLGLTFETELSDSLPEIRKIGLSAEQKMFNSTNNINTHKGLIFLLGLSIFSVAYTLKNNNNIFNEKKFRNIIKKISNNIISNELEKKSEKQTHGEKTFKQYGIKGAGARYQAEKAFPVIFEKILPFLEFEFSNKKNIQKEKLEGVLKKCLLFVIESIDDSNVLYRNFSEAENLKIFAKNVLIGEKSYTDLCDFCIQKNISPGGAADLLAISIFIFFIKQEFN